MRLNIFFLFKINSLVILYRLRIMSVKFLWNTGNNNLFFVFYRFLFKLTVLRSAISCRYLSRSIVYQRSIVKSNNVESTVKFLPSFKKYFCKCWNLEELILKLTGNGVKYSRIFRDALKYSRHDQRIIALAMNFYKNSSEYRVFKLSR